jgi:hypothetical protein
MSDLKQKITEYLPILRNKLKAEADKDKKRVLRIKINELKVLRGQL